MILITFTASVLVVFIAILSSISDFKSLRIPNWHSLSIIILFIPAYFLTPEVFSPLWQHISSMAVMFIISYIMFMLGMMGGGDSKLSTALGLWIGLNGLAAFVLFMSIAGGIIGLISLVIRKKKPFKSPAKGSWFDQAQLGKNAIPYGIAISLGFLASILHTGIFFNQLDELFKIIH